MTDMEYNRTSPFISNSLHYSSEIYPYVGEFAYLCPANRNQMTTDENDTADYLVFLLMGLKG